MKRFEVGLFLTLCFLYGITTTMASCTGGTSTSSNQCYQPCGLDECKCDTTNEPTYDNCNQTCLAQYCHSSINYMVCIAEQNCSQVCEPGACDMTCNAEQYCEQKANNGAKEMSCSSKGCKQSCADGDCKMMHCEADDCLQTCGQGGCTMNCTESVKTCSQSCTANTICTLECHAEICLQECSGPAHCIIAATSRVHLNFSLFVIAFFMFILH